MLFADQMVPNMLYFKIHQT